MTKTPATLNDPKIRANYDRLMQIAREQGIDASVEEFQRMFSTNAQPTEEQLAELRRRAAIEARWKKTPA